MLFTIKESIEDTIIRLLSAGKSTPADMYQLMQSEGKKISIQALYKALRYLIQEAVVVKSGQEVAISQEWIDTLTQSLNDQISIPFLADGESANYHFKSLANLDAYWKHITKPLQDQYEKYPVFIYNKYEIWHRIAGRLQSEIDYFDGFKKAEHYGFLVLGNNSIIDQQFKKRFQNDYLQIDTWNRSPLKGIDSVIIIADYIVTTKLSKQLNKNIAHIYETISLEEQAGEQLNKILGTNDRTKIKLERNAKKAKFLRTKLFKNFYLPQTIKDQYDLFTSSAS